MSAVNGGPAYVPEGRRGDGSAVQRDLNDCLAGLTIERYETGAMTAEGFSVSRIVFVGGDELWVVPQPVEASVTAATGLRLAVRYVFKARHRGRIIVPGVG